MRVYFFGHRGVASSGHNLYGAQLQPPDIDYDAAYHLIGALDQGFAPKSTRAQGAANLVEVRGWTVLAWWDYTGDKRPGSNSALIVEGCHSFDDVLHVMAEAFPTVYRRQPHVLRLTEESVTFPVR